MSKMPSPNTDDVQNSQVSQSDMKKDDEGIFLKGDEGIFLKDDESIFCKKNHTGKERTYAQVVRESLVDKKRTEKDEINILLFPKNLSTRERRFFLLFSSSKYSKIRSAG